MIYNWNNLCNIH